MTTTHHTMKRLKGFDYTKPYFYMVTLKRVKGLKPFGEITKEAEPPKDVQGRPRYLIANEITEAFAKVIRGFHGKWWGLWPIECFIVMPDHLHLAHALSLALPCSRSPAHQERTLPTLS